MVKEILKKLERFRYNPGMHEVLRDSFQLWAISISNQFDYLQSREDTYRNIIKGYSADELDTITECFAILFLNFSEGVRANCFNDYLGELYMSSEIENKKIGQFFTPYSVSKLIANLTVPTKVVGDNILSINEPACGSGGMVLAVLEELTNKGVNYASDVIVIANDIDKNCVAMTYLQLSLAGAAAVVLHGDTITQKFTDVWKTPALCLQQSRFEKFIPTLLYNN